MRLLADENLPLAAVRALRSAGHDVYSASESSAGASDAEHVKRAIAESRLIVTFDRDFGELAVRGPERLEAGVLLLRVTPASPEAVATLLVELLTRADIEWRGHISVVDEKHVRQRPI